MAVSRYQDQRPLPAARKSTRIIPIFVAVITVAVAAAASSAPAVAACPVDFINVNASVEAGSGSNVYDFCTGLSQGGPNPTISYTQSPSTSAPGATSASTSTSFAQSGPGVTDTATSTASANLAAGILEVLAAGSATVTSPNGGAFGAGTTNTSFRDALTFTNSTGQAVDISLTWAVQTSFTVPAEDDEVGVGTTFCLGSGTTCSVGTSALTVNAGLPNQFQYAFFQNEGSSSGVHGSNPTSGYDSISVTDNSPSQVVFSATFSVPSGTSTASIGAVLSAACQANGAPAGSAAETCNSLGTLSLALPPGVTFTSASGALLSAAGLVAAVLPASRSVQVGGTPATAFATMINSSATDATSCQIATLTGVPVKFLYQTTNPSTNALTGSPNKPVSIAAGGSQSFVIAFTPTAAFAPTNVALGFECGNLAMAPSQTGLNTVLLSASTTPVPDIVALAASGDPGIVDIPGATGTGVFAVATVNVGASASITATANTGTASLPVTLSLCETNPASGACLAPPAASVSTTINANGTPTFGIFVTGSGTVAFAPATNRITVQFTDGSGVVRGATSVAVRTQ